MGNKADLSPVVTGDNRREFPRSVFFGHTIVYDENGTTMTRSLKGTISPKGMGLIASTKRLEIGKKVLISFDGSEGMAPFAVEAKVASIIEHDGGGWHVCTLGMQFEKLDRNTASIIRSYVEKLEPNFYGSSSFHG